MVIRTNYVQQYKKSENKWKKELKALKKQNKILYSISNKYGSRREIKKIKKIKGGDLPRKLAPLPVIIWTPICC